MKHFTPLLLLCLLLLLFAQQAPGATPAEALSQLQEALPHRPELFTAAAVPLVAQAAEAVERTAAESGVFAANTVPAKVLADVRQLLTTKQGVDRALDEMLAMRAEVAALRAADELRPMLRAYLRITSQLIDLSGRLRYLLTDVLYAAAGEVATHPSEQQQLLDLLISYRSSVGAEVMTDLLFDPPADSETAGRTPSPALRAKVLELIAVAQHTELLPELAQFIADLKTPPALVIQAAETIRRIGLPQDPRPNSDPKLVPPTPITARQLLAIVARQRFALRDRDSRQRQAALVSWLDARVREGITEARFRFGRDEVQPGDWLLMRNPSPYNLFTDLSPGLFTHVGVVTLEQGSDGIRRMVVVDLPERGDRMPATNVEAFVKRTRHYVFLRHADPAVGRKMGEVARSIIGNETQFDLNFRTDRVVSLRGQSLAGQKINTYCAGLLLLCAQETTAPREEFFPVAEFPAGGHSIENLAQLRLSVGNDFISPTGALFGKRLAIVSRREPMYDPRREVEEAIYDYFADALVHKHLAATPDLFQALRTRMAEASRHNPLLAQALAKAAGVNAETDLVAAAKAAAVVETLDEIAFGCSRQFLKAREAMLAGPQASFADEGYTPQEIAGFQEARQRHAALWQLWEQQRLSPRSLRIELVKYYIDQGRQQLDQRFFPTADRGK